jgi:hypothetical protein
MRKFGMELQEIGKSIFIKNYNAVVPFCTAFFVSAKDHAGYFRK